MSLTYEVQNGKLIDASGSTSRSEVKKPYGLYPSSAYWSLLFRVWPTLGEG